MDLLNLELMRPITHCTNKQLTQICRQAVQLEILALKILPLLPDSIRKHCKVSAYLKGCLVLSTSDAIWASQLRYCLPEMRDKLRKEGILPGLTAIEIAVQIVPLKTPSKTRSKVFQLSEEAKACIIRESQSCTYQPLQKALLNLAED